MIELKVEGMTCGHCVSAVTRAVKEVDPSAEVRVDLGSGRVSVDGRAPEAALRKALGEAGYPASAAPQASGAVRSAGGCCGCH